MIKGTLLIGANLPRVSGKREGKSSSDQHFEEGRRQEPSLSEPRFGEPLINLI